MHWWDGQRWNGDTRPPSGEGGPFYYQPPATHAHLGLPAADVPAAVAAALSAARPRLAAIQPAAAVASPQGIPRTDFRRARRASHHCRRRPTRLAAHRTASAAKPLTCEQQFTAWKTGTANAPGKQLKADLGNVSSAGNDEDIAALTSALQAAGSDAVTLEQYPMPACADPRGYWVQILARIKASGDNAASNSGLNALLLAEAPLNAVPGMEQKLSAEEKKAGVTSTS
jgi:hypothetical protein